MKYELGDIFELEGDIFMVGETSIYMDVEYLLLNKLDSEEEPTNELYIYKVVGSGLQKVTEKSVLDIIIPVFNNKLQRDISEIIKQDKYNI